MSEFIVPDFLKNQSVKEVRDKMLATLPSWLEKTEGGFSYNFVTPTAIEKSHMVEFILIETIKNMFPAWAYDINLDRLGETRGLYRKKATKATGELTIIAKQGTELPKGTKFSTVSNYGEPSVEFENIEELILGEETTINIIAVNDGIVGNVATNTITLLSSPINEIKNVYNKLPTIGGTEEESDDNFRERIEEYDKNQGNLYVGSEADYKRWAMSIKGVGSALVIPANDETGLVKIVITDSNGDPATNELCTEVYNYIMRPDAPPERIAPVNAYLLVTPPTTIDVNIVASIKVNSALSPDDIKRNLVIALKIYYKQALTEKEIKYHKIIQILMGLEGITDIDDVNINNSTNNITIENDELPITNESMVTFNL